MDDSMTTTHHAPSSRRNAGRRPRGRMPAIKRGLGGLVALALASCNAAAEPPRETPPKEAPRIARPTIERPAQRPVEPVMAPSVCKVAK